MSLAYYPSCSCVYGYTVHCRSDSGIVMVCFSPDDLFLLTAAVDNEVRQYTAVDGRQNLELEIPKTGRSDNYTRAYYMNGGMC